MFPPEDAELVFMGCGKRSSSKIKLGIIAKPEDIFTQASYNKGYDKAKPIKNYFTYYDNAQSDEAIGFSLYQSGIKLIIIVQNSK